MPFARFALQRAEVDGHGVGLDADALSRPVDVRLVEVHRADFGVGVRLPAGAAAAPFAQDADPLGARHLRGELMQCDLTAGLVVVRVGRVAAAALHHAVRHLLRRCGPLLVGCGVRFRRAVPTLGSIFRLLFLKSPRRHHNMAQLVVRNPRPKDDRFCCVHRLARVPARGAAVRRAPQSCLFRTPRGLLQSCL